MEDDESDEEAPHEVVLRPKSLESSTSNEEVWKGQVKNKTLLNIQEAPYFSFRPASENDIFTISKGESDTTTGSGGSRKPITSTSSTSNINRFSMTPEVPSISFVNLPKNYLDTPTIDKYRESKSLFSIQSTEIRKSMADDLTMPRHFTRKSELMLNLEGLGSNTSIASGMSDKTGTGISRKAAEMSKRLKAFRNNLPPLMIAARDKEKGEKEK